MFRLIEPGPYTGMEVERRSATHASQFERHVWIWLASLSSRALSDLTAFSRWWSEKRDAGKAKMRQVRMLGSECSNGKLVNVIRKFRRAGNAPSDPYPSESPQTTLPQFLFSDISIRILDFTNRLRRRRPPPYECCSEILVSPRRNHSQTRHRWPQSYHFVPIE